MRRIQFWNQVVLLLFGVKSCQGFLSPFARAGRTTVAPWSSATNIAEDELTAQKKKLLDLLQTEAKQDPILADPITKEPLTVTSKSVAVGSSARTRIELKSPSNTFVGSSDTFLNLLEPVKDKKDTDTSSSSSTNNFARAFIPLIPPPLRSALATAGLPVGENYVPMRDLFTSPTVSFAYERGWRQNFRAAGFPGPDEEARMAMAYFAPSMARSAKTGGVLVDMSCATGLFTRRFAASGKYQRVLGCDYSESMLQEARRRIRADANLLDSIKSNQVELDLVRCDVGQIPMRSDSVDAVHAGAAMHCWPDLPAAVSEIHRVLSPGGRYFATTFLSSYFGTLQRAEGGANGPSRQAFQYFQSVDQLRQLLVDGGFAPEKVLIEVLGTSCVVIRCEK